MKKLVPSTLNESIGNVLKGPSKKGINQNIDRKAVEYGISDPEKRVKLEDLQVVIEDMPYFKKEMQDYKINWKANNFHDNGNIDSIDISGKRKVVGVWAVENYDIDTTELNEFLDGTYYD